MQNKKLAKPRYLCIAEVFDRITNAVKVTISYICNVVIKNLANKSTAGGEIGKDFWLYGMLCYATVTATHLLIKPKVNSVTNGGHPSQFL